MFARSLVSLLVGGWLVGLFVRLFVSWLIGLWYLDEGSEVVRVGPSLSVYVSHGVVYYPGQPVSTHLLDAIARCGTERKREGHNSGNREGKREEKRGPQGQRERVERGLK